MHGIVKIVHFRDHIGHIIRAQAWAELNPSLFETTAWSFFSSNRDSSIRRLPDSLNRILPTVTQQHNTVQQCVLQYDNVLNNVQVQLYV